MILNILCIGKLSPSFRLDLILERSVKERKTLLKTTKEPVKNLKSKDHHPLISKLREFGMNRLSIVLVVNVS